MIGLRELLDLRGLAASERVKLARHRDRRYDMNVVLASGFFDVYQSWQSRRVFDECDTVAAFIGEEARTARLIGVYRVGARAPKGSARMPRGFPFPSMRIDHCYVYGLQRDRRFEDLAGRVVIDWGASARSWVQRMHRVEEKEVVELRPTGFASAFPGFLECDLSLSELHQIVAAPQAHAEWLRALANVGGVYLIRDGVTGEQYVGSASGEGGLLARWRAYAANGHGGNKRLKTLLSRTPERRNHLYLTILQILDRSTSAKEAVAREQLFKRKLGSRAHGLNAN